MTPEDQQPEILIVDDGELDDAVEQLGRLGLSCRRESGPRPNGTLSPPTGLLVTTPRRAAAVRRGSPAHAPAGRPIRIVAVRDDATSSRRLLRRTGFQLVVRLPVHDEVWRLLAAHALYAGSERREDPRVAVGSATSVRADGAMPAAVLMDVSNRGCRLMSQDPFAQGSDVHVRIPDREGLGAPLIVPGRIARTGRVEDVAEGEPSHVSAVVFSPSLSETDRMRLGVIINRWSLGPASMGTSPAGPRVPSCQSAEIPGLLLDDETDPAVRVDAPVELGGADAPAEERRSRGRGSFAVPVVARGRKTRRMLIGRDLSSHGMRVEPHADVEVGQRFMLALYGTDTTQPVVVSATVIRDDGDAGLALRFDGSSAKVREALEKIVACLPDLDTLKEGEAFGLGAVVGEVLEDGIEDAG